MKTLNIETSTHGRVLVRECGAPTATIVGFHGYMENAEVQMERLESVPGADRWTLVSVQGLHRFYRGRTQETIASWMTRQDRELMIADNIAYADRVIDAVHKTGAALVTTGFSQGVAMAFRAALRGRMRADAIVAVGGDVPPELLEDTTIRFPPTLLVRGERDEWYTAQKLDADVAALRGRGLLANTVVYSGGHEWTPDVSAEVSTFVQRLW